MKIVVAPDSFKGTLTAKEAADAMAAGIGDVAPSITTILLPVADGGEGTMRSLVRATNGREVTHIVEDPLGREIEASYGVLGDDKTCVIEIAEASGLMHVTQSERNPLYTTTSGTGQLIKKALDAGFRTFIIGLGGSATNDAGTGILQALGMRFFNKNEEELPRGGASLIDLHRIDARKFDRRIDDCSFLLASDVKNPLIGENSASAIFGPQKGASPTMVKQLDQGLTRFADVVEKQTGISLHHVKGAGAAGGAGAAFLAFFPTELRLGIEVVLQAMNFSTQLKQTDLILTGEGKTDAQTLSGKAPIGIAKEAQQAQKRVILISGIVDEASKEQLEPFFTEIHSVSDSTASKKESLENAFNMLRKKTKNVIEQYIKSNQIQV